MKLFVQIPCLNEESIIEKTIKNIPKHISGIDEIEILIIDDGCTDNTIKVAESCNVKHFVRHERTLGLASAFLEAVLHIVLEMVQILSLILMGTINMRVNV